MSLIKLKNKKGTSNKNPPSNCSSWLDFWEKQKDQKVTTCQVHNCNGNSDVGGHVIKTGEGSKEYILPMCYRCNNKPDGEVFEGSDSDLVSVT